METRLQKHHDLGGGSNYLSDKVIQQMGVQWMFLGQVERNREKVQRKDRGSLNQGVEKFRERVLLLSRFSRVGLCDPIDGSPPGSPVPGILQAGTLEWVAISFSNDESEK